MLGCSGCLIISVLGELTTGRASLDPKTANTQPWDHGLAPDNFSKTLGSNFWFGSAEQDQIWVHARDRFYR